jgi:hypothetical protein
VKVLVAGDRGGELVRAYTEHAMTYDDFTSSRFVRPRRIRDLLSVGLFDDMLRRQITGPVPARIAETAQEAH